MKLTKDMMYGTVCHITSGSMDAKTLSNNELILCIEAVKDLEKDTIKSGIFDDARKALEEEFKHREMMELP